METLLSPDFWSNLILGTLKASPIFIPLLILAFWAGFIGRNTKGDDEMRELRTRNEFLENRLQLVRAQNAGEARTIGDIRTEVDELRKLIQANVEPSALEPIIKEVDATATALIMANSTTDHILTAERLAISNTEETDPKVGSLVLSTDRSDV